MNKQIYIGNTPLIDLSGYATEQYVQTAVDNVDVTDQLQNYVLKDGDKVLSANDFTDALKTKLEGLSNYDDTQIRALIAAINSFDYTSVAELPTAAESTMYKIYLVPSSGAAGNIKDEYITLKIADNNYQWEKIGTTQVDLSGYYTKAEVDTKISNDTSLFLTADDVYQKPEINNQVQILTSAISQVNDAVASKTDASAVSAQINSSIAALDLPNTYQPKGSYLVADDISTFVDAAAVATQINSSIAALDLANTYQAKGDYLVADDISTFVDADTIAATYETKNDASNHVEGAGVMHIVKCTSTEYAAIETKDATTLYIVTD